MSVRRKPALKPPGAKPKRPGGQGNKKEKPKEVALLPEAAEGFEDLAAEAPTLRQSTRQRVEDAQKERQRADQVAHSQMQCMISC